ncbi:MAG: alanine dehydrogenase [Anaerolineae bacterium]|nr:alanine dehydrogenase [Anaerolineae bacterium]
MEIGIPLERKPGEYRVGLTPQWVSVLSEAGHRCYIEQGAGKGVGFEDTDYIKAGGKIVYSPEEVYQRADLLLKVGSPVNNELGMLRDGQTVCAFWHIAAQPREVTQALIDKRITALAYEAIQRDDGITPVRLPLSEIAGRMIPQIAARWLQNDGGGRGILISGITGTPPADVGILGAGIVGVNAARAFLGLGARVIVLDKSLERLRYVDTHFSGQVTTMLAYDYNIARVLTFANVFVAAVLVPGERTPVVVTRKMVSAMRPRSIILDIDIDQGGSVETSRPTTHHDPVFVEENVLHYCVPNITGVVARTATSAYLNGAWSYIDKLVKEGYAAADHDSALKRGIVAHDGELLHKTTAEKV